SPVLVTGVPLTPGSALLFTTLAGLVNGQRPESGGFVAHSGGAPDGLSARGASVRAPGGGLPRSGPPRRPPAPPPPPLPPPRPPPPSTAGPAACLGGRTT